MLEQPTRRLSRNEVSRIMLLMGRFTAEANRAAHVLGEFSDNRSVRALINISTQEALSPSALADVLNVSRSAMSRVLTPLVDAGLVDRARTSDNARQRRLTLTPRGRRTMSQLDAAFADFFADTAPLVKETLMLARLDVETEPRPEPSALVLIERLAAAGEEFGESVKAAMVEFGVTEFRTRRGLNFLKENGPTRPTGLAHELGLSPQGATDLIDRLETLGLARRRRPRRTSDGRAVVVVLTPRGQRAVRELDEALAGVLPPLLCALAPTIGARIDERPVTDEQPVTQ